MQGLGRRPVSTPGDSAELFVAVSGFSGDRVDAMATAPDHVEHGADGGQCGFVREFRHQMSLSFGTSRISPISMFASLGATLGWDELRLSLASAELTDGDGCPGRGGPCSRQLRARRVRCDLACLHATLSR
jgi:hypothetical protein